ncbi:unnamed protein product [Linum trigynum]|uniref:Uncharacterized protein n=1 Tax=Linum trigynum TaxID=586398 RepID=A0AAV2ET80_9ROSI
MLLTDQALGPQALLLSSTSSLLRPAPVQDKHPKFQISFLANPRERRLLAGCRYPSRNRDANSQREREVGKLGSGNERKKAASPSSLTSSLQMFTPLHYRLPLPDADLVYASRLRPRRPVPPPAVAESPRPSLTHTVRQSLPLRQQPIVKKAAAYAKNAATKNGQIYIFSL